MKHEFYVTDKEGKEVKCNTLFTFECNMTQKTYIAYTDHSRTPNGEINVFASVLCLTEDGEGTRFLPIESEYEWKIVQIILDEITSINKEDIVLERRYQEELDDNFDLKELLEKRIEQRVAKLEHHLY